ncbi:MAG: rubrerythrin family protein [Ruminococcus sp.]|nr:rubrerythrin family protein [Ruminococcus sp.]
MAVIFMESQTKENLMKAFAGESQARNRYTFAEEKARVAKLFAIADIFHYTADQEKAHAERFYDLLKEMTGQTIQITGGYPIDPMDSIEAALRAAEHNEREEFEDVYQNFARVAKEEGFLEVASAFNQIAEIEHVHQKRFAELANLLENNHYFVSDGKGKWVCTNCGHIHEGNQAPKNCPVCRYEQGYFLPYEFAEYTGKNGEK